MSARRISWIELSGLALLGLRECRFFPRNMQLEAACHAVPYFVFGAHMTIKKAMRACLLQNNNCYLMCM
jgi:hypothetical protein